jgi:hypothetical protein
MSNMSYCRFENTLNDLRTCEAHLTEQVGNRYEQDARRDLIKLCVQVLEDVGLVIETPDGDDGDVSREGFITAFCEKADEGPDEDANA